MCLLLLLKAAGHSHQPKDQRHRHEVQRKVIQKFKYFLSNDDGISGGIFPFKCRIKEEEKIVGRFFRLQYILG